MIAARANGTTASSMRDRANVVRVRGYVDASTVTLVRTEVLRRGITDLFSCRVG